MSRIITWSPSLTVPLTHDCPWNCRYCGYRSDRQGLIAEAELERLLRRAVQQGATEVLFLSGEIPESMPHIRQELESRGFRDFIDFAQRACERALELQLLPHCNLGAMSAEQFARLGPVNASMGLMLENVDDAFNRTVAPEKSVAGRIRTIRAAGESRIPYTSGILIGLGESRDARLRSLDVLAELHAEFGHLQEIILQNFVPNTGSAIRGCPQTLGFDDYAELIGHWRRVAPGVAIQIPPNLNPFWRELLPLIDDLGGISADGDLVNPDTPWEAPAVYREACESAGLELRHRWPVYEQFIQRGWISPRIRQVLQDRSSTWPLAPAAPGGGCRAGSEILSKPFHGQALSVDDCLALVEGDGTAPEELRQAADELNRRMHGDEVTYVVNRNANFTNVCVTHCSFCGFYRPAGHPEAYTRSIGAVVERIAQTPWVTEVCLQGGIHPELGFDYYVELLRAIRAAFPKVHLHAYSPMEIHSLRTKTGWSYDRILGRLMEAGLGSMPGTAAEILDDAVRQQVSPDKLNASQWVEIVRTAHGLGLRSTATLMFGHTESWADRFRHMDLLRRLQLETGGFTEFIPLAFLPYRNRLGSRLAREESGGLEAVARRGESVIQMLYPIARLFFGKAIPNLQTSWVKLGPEKAAEMLRHGCNDFGGTLYEESITRESGGPHGECLAPDEIRSWIGSVQKKPRQRTTLYGPVAGDETEEGRQVSGAQLMNRTAPVVTS
ncbi:MAG: hypothetical protein RLZ45_3268 [Verrucomicrobiota bacterium]